jgi:hypothetical protein
MNQEDGSILYRYLVDALIQGEIKMNNISDMDEYNPFSDSEDDEGEKPPFKAKETFLERSTQFYLSTNVKCMDCDYDSWNFTLSSDLILDIIPRFNQTELNLKLGYGMDSRVIGSKIDAINAQEDKNWMDEKSGKRKKGKKKKKHKGKATVEVDKKNILGGEGGLLAEEFHAEAWVDEKINAQ